MNMKKYMDAMHKKKEIEKNHPEWKDKLHVIQDKQVFCTSSEEYKIYLEIHEN